MSNPEKNITDAELRYLLNQILLDEKENESETSPLIDLEASIVFGQQEMLIPNPTKELRLKQQLKDSNSGKVWIKRLFVWMAAFSVVLLFYVLLVKHDADDAVVTTHLPTKELPILTDESPLNKEPTAQSNILNPSVQSADIDITSSINDETKRESIAEYPSYANSAYIMDASIPLGEEMMVLSDTIKLPIDTFFNGITSLELSSLYFPIKVVTDNSSRLTIKGKMAIIGEMKKNRKASFEMFYIRKGNSLRVVVELTKNSNWVFNANKYKLEGFISITIPANADLKIKNASGDIVVQDVSGKLCELASDYGNITASNLHSELSVSTNSGEIQLSQISGNTEAKSSYGNMKIAGVSGNLFAKCSSGNLDISEVVGNTVANNYYGNTSLLKLQGDLELKASSGNVNLRNWNGKKCSISVSYGDINIRETIGDIKINATSGNVHVQDAKGNVSCNTAYGSQWWENITGNMQTKSNSGDIELRDFAGNTSMHSSYGNILTKGTLGNMTLTANSGHIRVHEANIADSLLLMSSYGDIRLKLVNEEKDLTYDLDTENGIISMAKEDSLAIKKSNIYIRMGKVQVIGKAKSGNIYVE